MINFISGKLLQLHHFMNQPVKHGSFTEYFFLVLIVLVLLSIFDKIKEGN